MKVLPPPRCDTFRKATFWEMFKFIIMGKIAGFDPEHECRCVMYKGHSQYQKDNPQQALHEDIHGKRW